MTPPPIDILGASLQDDEVAVLAALGESLARFPGRSYGWVSQ